MWRKLKKILMLVGVALVFLIAVLLFNTLRYSADNIVTPTKVDLAAVDPAIATQRLSEAVRFQTVARRLQDGVFDDFLAWMTDAFPLVHQQLSRTLVGGYTPVYIWTGQDATQPAILLTAHYDVVPAQAETLPQWNHPPYAGEIDKGFVWGRGTLDTKGTLVAMLSAAETLIAEGFVPKRTIVFSFGHDEETKGDGATAVVEYLQTLPLAVDWSLDEGSFVFNNVIPGLSRPVASINVAEKGVVTLDLVATAHGGHSSMPPNSTAIGYLAEALGRLQNQPVPGGLTDVSAEFFSGLGPHFDFSRRVLFANQWLFRPLLEYGLAQAPTTHALLRTTTAPTMLSAAPAPNILPSEASATVNFRIHPRDSIASVTSHVRQVVGVENAIEVRNTDFPRFEASKVSASNTAGYRAIGAALADAFGELVVVPGLTIAATDSRIYEKLTQNSYRINPFMLEGSDLPLLHGINERLSIDNLHRAQLFYTRLLLSQ